MDDPVEPGHVSKARLTSAGAAAVRMPAAPAAVAAPAAAVGGEAHDEAPKWTFDEVVDAR